MICDAKLLDDHTDNRSSRIRYANNIGTPLPLNEYINSVLYTEFNIGVPDESEDIPSREFAIHERGEELRV